MHDEQATPQYGALGDAPREAVYSWISDCVGARPRVSSLRARAQPLLTWAASMRARGQAYVRAWSVLRRTKVSLSRSAHKRTSSTTESRMAPMARGPSVSA